MSIESLSKNTLKVATIDARGTASWRPAKGIDRPVRGERPGKLKLAEAIGAAVIECWIESRGLVLSGGGRAQVLGTVTVRQTLDRSE